MRRRRSTRRSSDTTPSIWANWPGHDHRRRLLEHGASPANGVTFGGAPCTSGTAGAGLQRIQLQAVSTSAPGGSQTLTILKRRSVTDRTRPCVSADADGESGVSLIELIIAIAITGVIMAPIGAADLLRFPDHGRHRAVVSESTSANVMASYFARRRPGRDRGREEHVRHDLVRCGCRRCRPRADDGRDTDDYDLGTTAAPVRMPSVLYRRTCANGALTGVARVAIALSGRRRTSPATPRRTAQRSGRSPRSMVQQRRASGQDPYTTVS